MTDNPSFKHDASHARLGVMMALFPLLFLSSTISMAASSTQSVQFSHNDWELACDNVLTCRAAGYHAEGSEQLVSVLLTRQAGAMSPVTVQVQLGGWLDEAAADGKSKLSNPLPIGLWLNQKNSGSIKLALDSATGDLTAVQTQALLAALKQGQSVEFRYQNTKWSLSSEGSSAVLLKMDDVQGRVGTSSALIRKGNASLKRIKVAPIMPTVRAVAVRDTKPQMLAVNSPEAKTLFKTLQNSATFKVEDCETMTDASQFDGASITVYALNAKTALLEVPCWRGAYNEGYGYWVMDRALKQVQQLVTLSGSGYGSGAIEMAQKGRGLGDCWSTASWVWNGQRFVLRHEETDQMCRGFAGGAWDMPSYVSQPRP